MTLRPALISAVVLALAPLSVGQPPAAVAQSVSPRALSEPIQLPGEVPQRFTRNVWAGDQIRRRIFVPSYRVAFMVGGAATARTTDTRATVSTVLRGAEPALIQAITDRAYADLIERLTAAGFEVVPEAEWRAAPSAARLEAGRPGIQENSRGLNGTNQSFALVNPTTLGSWPETAMPVNLGAIRGMTRELDATMVAPRFSLSYAVIEARGGGAFGLLSRGAQAGFTPLIHGGPVIAGFTMEPWRVRVGQHGGFMEYKVDGRLDAPGAFGLVSDGQGRAQIATPGAGGAVDSWDSRLYGPAHVHSIGYFDVDPEEYTRLALQALALQNAVAVEELRRARR